MADERPSKDPLFVKIAENPEGGDIAADLQATPLRIKLGDTLTISSRPYIVAEVRTPGGEFDIRHKRDDLRGNLTSFDLLHDSGALPADCEIDGLCLRNTKNGDCLIELCHAGAAEGAEAPVAKPGKHHFFARLDASSVNPHIEGADFDEIVVRASPCMFGWDTARVVTTTGRLITITERSMVVDEPIERVDVGQKLGIYEREIMRRMVSVITLLLRGGKIGRVVTALPRGAYYSFLVAGAARGLVSPETMLAWFDQVDERVAMLRERFVSDIRRVAPSLTVEQYSLMDSACDALRGFFGRRLGQGAEPFDAEALVAEAIEAIEVADPFARYVFSAGVPKPTTFRELADLTYVLSNLVEMGEETTRRILVIGIYDPTENILWNELRRVRHRSLLEPRGLYRIEGPGRSKLDSLSYVGIMPLEQVIFDVSPEYMDKNLGGAGRLYALQNDALGTVDRHLISGMFSRPITVTKKD